jgi:HSP20 family molecular chaperone IbpA
MKYLTYDFLRLFHYTKDDQEVLSAELPGIDPKEVKLTYDSGRIYLNNKQIAYGFNSSFYDFSAVKAELKHGLLTITIPRKKPVRTEIPLTVV